MKSSTPVYMAACITGIPSKSAQDSASRSRTGSLISSDRKPERLTTNSKRAAMNPTRFVHAAVITSTVVAALGMAVNVLADGNGPNLFGFANPSGIVRTYSVNGAIDFGNPFFHPPGTNGRSCGSCHQPADGWTIVPSHVQARFEATDGDDPIFRTMTDRTHRPPTSRPSRPGD